MDGAKAGPGGCFPPVDVSIVVPLLNEVDSLARLHREVSRTMQGMGVGWEIVYCDDGSTDGSFEILRELAAGDGRVRALRLRRTFGQTGAMAAGFAHAGGRIIVPIDADLQNDPRDIPGLVAKLDEGFDVVSGWRRDRKDPLLGVTLPSRLGNALIGRVTGVRLRDYGCTLKAYRRDTALGLDLWGRMHRFIPALAAAGGARICEVAVGHRRRAYGESKYRLSKALQVLRDLLVVRFVLERGARPPAPTGALARKLMGERARTPIFEVAESVGGYEDERGAG